MSLIEALSAKPHIAAAIQNASERTGADFDYLIKTAMKESSLNCSAKSATSTACGLFQFTQQTWLSMLKKNGEELGYGQYAQAISVDASGRARVADPAARQEILALRNDPHASALMAGAYAKESEERLENRLGRSVSSGELYIAHFLGAGGASKLISTAEETPNARADLLFPEAAAANKAIFYSNGRARSVGEVYDKLAASQGGQQIVQADMPQRVATDPKAYTAASVAAAGILANALPGLGDIMNEYSPAFRSVQAETSPAEQNAASVYAAPYATRIPQATSISVPSSIALPGSINVINASAFGRAPLKLSPEVVQMLSTLDPLSLISKQKEDEEQKSARRNEGSGPSFRIPINLS